MNESVFHSKQKWNHDECHCDCKESDDWSSCIDDYMWNLSTCDCECNKRHVKLTNIKRRTSKFVFWGKHSFCNEVVFKDGVVFKKTQPSIEIDVIVNICLFKFCWKVYGINVKKNKFYYRYHYRICLNMPK